MSNLNQKIKITKIIKENLPSTSSYTNIDIEHLLFRWWATGRSGTGLRLSEEGKHAFTEAQIEYYDYPLLLENKKDLSKTEYTLTLNKKLNCPFYVGYKTQNYKSAFVRIYDSKIAMVISLYGNLREYLQI